MPHTSWIARISGFSIFRPEQTWFDASRLTVERRGASAWKDVDHVKPCDHSTAAWGRVKSRRNAWSNVVTQMGAWSSIGEGRDIWGHMGKKRAYFATRG